MKKHGLRKHGLAYLSEVGGLVLFGFCWLSSGFALFALAGVLCVVLLALEGTA